MKRLMLLRHAKSSWAGEQLADHDRPLSSRGMKDASRMGAYLREKNLIPQKIYCSTALRARQTMNLLCGELENPPARELMEGFYLCPSNELLAYLNRLPEDFTKVMFIGHNPEMMDFTEKATGKPLPYHKFSTCGLGIIDFNINTWKEARFSGGKLFFFTAPRILRS